MNRLRKHMTFANVMSMVALFVAMGGTGYAALKLPKNSVGSRQIKANAITGPKVKNGSLSAGDFGGGQLPAGPQGAQGPRGAQGPQGVPGQDGTNGADGTAAAFARVGANAVLDDGFPSQNKNVVQANVQHEASGDATHTGPGIYCFGGLPFDPRSAMVTPDSAGFATSTNYLVSVSVQRGNNLNSCNADHQQARVSILQVSNSAAPTLMDHGFYIWLEK